MSLFFKGKQASIWLHFHSYISAQDQVNHAASLSLEHPVAAYRKADQIAVSGCGWNHGWAWELLVTRTIAVHSNRDVLLTIKMHLEALACLIFLLERLRKAMSLVQGENEEGSAAILSALSVG